MKCTKFAFCWAPPQTPLGELTALPPQIPLTVFKGSTSKGERRREGKER